MSEPPPIIRCLIASEPYGVVVGLSAGALGLASLPLSCVHSFPIPAGLALLLFPMLFCLTMAIYNADRWRDYASDFDSPERAAIWNTSRLRCIALTGLPLAVSFGIVFVASSAQNRVVSLSLFASVAALGYYYSLHSSRFLLLARIRRAKDIPYLKTIFVSAVWAMAMLFPAALSSRFRMPAITAFATFVFLKMIPACNAGDLRDIASDRVSARKTLPIMFGFERIVVWMICLNIIAAAWILFAIWAGWLPVFGTALLTNCAFGCASWSLLRRARINVHCLLVLIVLDVFSVPVVTFAAYAFTI